MRFFQALELFTITLFHRFIISDVVDSRYLHYLYLLYILSFCCTKTNIHFTKQIQFQNFNVHRIKRWTILIGIYLTVCREELLSSISLEGQSAIFDQKPTLKPPHSNVCSGLLLIASYCLVIVLMKHINVLYFICIITQKLLYVEVVLLSIPLPVMKNDCFQIHLLRNYIRIDYVIPQHQKTKKGQSINSFGNIKAIYILL